jgi:ABC-type nitrate/sulfonate/bicarbonate transport system substrate-binding protein
MFHTFPSVLLHFLLPFLLLASLPSATALTVAAVRQNIEATPLVITVEDHYNSTSYKFINAAPALGSNPNIDLYAGAEVHVLHDAPQHPDLRVLATVVQFSYRIVADKRKNITKPSDLRGKRIGVVGNVTSEYFAYRYLRDVAGLNESEYTLVKAGALCYSLPCGNGTYPQMLVTGQLDAFTAFEPTTTVGGMALGEENAIFFRDDSLYRKLNVLYTTQAKLDNSTSRAEIVGFLRALGKTHEVFTKEPEKIWPRVAKITATNNTTNPATEEIMRTFWPLTKWDRELPVDMVDLMVEEDKWVAMDENLPREPMSREKIQSLIDDGPLKEALALGR